MIRAMIFDLDGTLVQTERLKALSYARAVVELCPHETSEEAVVEAFKEVVGLPRREVAVALMERFGLEDALDQYEKLLSAYRETESYLSKQDEEVKKRLRELGIRVRSP